MYYSILVYIFEATVFRTVLMHSVRSSEIQVVVSYWQVFSVEKTSDNLANFSIVADPLLPRVSQFLTVYPLAVSIYVLTLADTSHTHTEGIHRSLQGPVNQWQFKTRSFKCSTSCYAFTTCYVPVDKILLLSNAQDSLYNVC